MMLIYFYILFEKNGWTPEMNEKSMFCSRGPERAVGEA